MVACGSGEDRGPRARPSIDRRRWIEFPDGLRLLPNRCSSGSRRIPYRRRSHPERDAESRLEAATAAPAAGQDAAAASIADPLGPGANGTNVQEAGVDEPDTLKSDGETIFTLERGVLRAVSATADPRLLDELKLPR